MSIRETIKEIIEEMVEIDENQIREAMQEIDIKEMVIDQIRCQMPERIQIIIEEEIEGAVREALDYLE